MPEPIAVKIAGPITKGSILVVAGEDLDAPGRAYLMNELRRISGHSEFFVFSATEGASLAVFPKEEFDDLVKDRVDEQFHALLARISNLPAGGGANRV